MAETRKSFKGGYRFKRVLGALKNGTVEEAPFPQKVIIPLQQGVCSLLKPWVQQGDRVQAGQVIARDDESLSTPLHATVSGTVETMLMSGKGRRQKPRAVVIAADGEQDIRPLEGVPASWEDASPDELGALLYQAGVTALGESGIPTRHKSSTIEPAAVRCILVGAVDAEPLGLTSSTVIGDAKQFVTGLAILRRALSDVPVHLAVAEDNTALYSTLDEATRSFGWLTLHTTKRKYPADFGALLAEAMLGDVLPPGRAAIDLGAVAIDPQTAIHAYEAVMAGKPLLDRLIAFTGNGFSQATTMRVRIGSPYEGLVAGRIAQGVEPRLVSGGVLAGEQISDMAEPVLRQVSQVSALVENRRREMFAFMRPGLKRDSHTNAFLSAVRRNGPVGVDTNVHGEQRPCVSCCYCDEVCPRDLLPHLLNKMIVHDQLEETLALNVMACIDCGLCSYVCPSKIPLMRNIVAGKKEITKNGWDEDVA